MNSNKNGKLPLLNRNGSPGPAVLALFATAGGAYYLYKKNYGGSAAPGQNPEKETNGNGLAVYKVPPPTGEADFKMNDLIKSKMPSDVDVATTNPPTKKK